MRHPSRVAHGPGDDLHLFVDQDPHGTLDRGVLEAPAGAHPGGSGVLDEVVRPQLVQHPGQHVRQVAVALEVVDEQLKN